MSAIEELITELAKLPGIGRKTAQRLTFHLLQQPSDQAVRLLRDYLAWERQPMLRRRATAIVRRMEEGIR